eukprot:4602964-Prymnesium_polylepis.1
MLRERTEHCKHVTGKGRYVGQRLHTRVDSVNILVTPVRNRLPRSPCTRAAAAAVAAEAPEEVAEPAVPAGRPLRGHSRIA